MSVNSNLHSKSKRVYLDKFVTLPHLPSNPGTGPGFNKSISHISPNLDHTGIRTAFQEKVKRAVKPNGRLTYDYKLQAFSQIATPARTLARLDKKKVRSHCVRNALYEERLRGLEEKRTAFDKICERQLQQESTFLLPVSPSLDEPSLGCLSMSTGQTQSTSTRTHKKSTRKQKRARPKKIFSQQGIVDLLMDTSDMSICASSIASHVSSDSNGCQDGSASVLTGGGTTESGKVGRRILKSDKWDVEALRRVYGNELDDMIQEKEEQEQKQQAEGLGVYNPVQSEADSCEATDIVEMDTADETKEEMKDCIAEVKEANKEKDDMETNVECETETILEAKMDTPEEAKCDDETKEKLNVGAKEGMGEGKEEDYSDDEEYADDDYYCDE